MEDPVIVYSRMWWTLGLCVLLMGLPFSSQDLVTLASSETTSEVPSKAGDKPVSCQHKVKLITNIFFGLLNASSLTFSTFVFSTFVFITYWKKVKWGQNLLETKAHWRNWLYNANVLSLNCFGHCAISAGSATYMELGTTLVSN